MKKSNPQEKSAKNKPKNKQISIKISPKTSNTQVFKKTRNSRKKTSPNSRENRKVGNTGLNDYGNEIELKLVQ